MKSCRGKLLRVRGTGRVKVKGKGKAKVKVRFIGSVRVGVGMC